jgi:uncharacterized membrane protein
VWSFVTLVITGIPQGMSTAMKVYYSPMFWLKMYILLVAIVFTVTVRRTITRTDEARLGPVVPKLVAVISIGLWTAVAAAARLIGLLG